MRKRRKPLGGNSHQRTISRAQQGETNTPPLVVAELGNKKTMLEIAFGWQVVATVGMLVISVGLGVLSMNPPETKISIWTCSAGFALLLVRLCIWIAFERPEPVTTKALFISVVCGASGLLWFACVALANSKAPHNGPEVLAFDALGVGVGNMPERKAVTNTWDGKPWDDTLYSDIRVGIENKSGFRIESIDLTISIPEKERNRSTIGAISQLSQILGVEFPKPQSPDINLKLKGTDGNIYNAPFPFDELIKNGWMLPVPSLKVFVPKLLSGQRLKLIIGVLPEGSRDKITPKELDISGTYQVVSNGSAQRTETKRTIEVR